MLTDRAAYDHAYADEAVRTYPVIDALEARYGYALDPQRYLPAARRLACPIKRDKAGRFRQVALWQHGRVLYAVVRHLLERLPSLTALDIGTAKGYSALCVLWALEDAGRDGVVHTVDVLDPRARVARQSVAELDGLLTLEEILAPWPEASKIQAHQRTGIDWLEQHDERLAFVYVDGKHTAPVVRREAELIRDRQEPGDVTVFDDVQIPAVAQALETLDGYLREDVHPTRDRMYVIARRL